MSDMVTVLPPRVDSVCSVSTQACDKLKKKSQHQGHLESSKPIKSQKSPTKYLREMQYISKSFL